MFTGRSLLLGTAIALLCDVIAYTLQADALRRMPRSLFSILTSTEPAVGAILGLLALGQRITILQWAGIVAVVIASIGATRAHRTQEAQRPRPSRARTHCSGSGHHSTHAPNRF
jgi:inner membrane transporter RhtA